MKKNTPNITTTTEVTASIFLDEHNLDIYLEEAKRIQAEYGSNEIGCIAHGDRYATYVDITGNEYLERTEKTIQAAYDIMSGKLLPDIFARIGLKDGTFVHNRRITVFKNGIRFNMLSERYPDYTEEMALCVTTMGKHEMSAYSYDRYDKSKELADNKTARLAITKVDGSNRICPLLTEDMRVNGLTQMRYLRQNEIKPGCIYQEKDGKEYLFLGRIGIVKDGYMVKKDKFRWERCIHCIRITEETTAMIEEAESLEDFLRIYIKSQVKTNLDKPYFYQTGPQRKFIKETGSPFAGSWYSVTNDAKTWSETRTADYLFGIAVPNEDGTGTVTTKYAIIA